MNASDFDILVLAARCGWPAHMLSGQMINPYESHWRSRVASALPQERDELLHALTAMAAARDRDAAALAELDRRNQVMRDAFKAR